MQERDFSREPNRIEQIRQKINEDAKKLEAFLYPHELEEYKKLLEIEEKDGRMVDKFKPEEYKKIIYYRYLGQGFNKDFAGEISSLQTKREYGQELNTEEKNRERFLRFYQSLCVDIDKKFTTYDVEEFFNLSLKEESSENLSDSEKEKLLFYRWVSDIDFDLTVEESKRIAKLIIMKDYGLLNEQEVKEYEDFLNRKG